MSFVIRPLQPDDSIGELTEMLHRAYKPLADMGLRFLATHQDEATTKYRLESGQAFVGEIAGRIVATVTLYTSSEEQSLALYRDPGIYRFGQFAVEPEFQKEGLGSQLLDFVEDQARKQGATHLALDTSEQATHLIAYYEKRGYRIVTYTQWNVTNYRSVVMRKPLC